MIQKPFKERIRLPRKAAPKLPVDDVLAIVTKMDDYSPITIAAQFVGQLYGLTTSKQIDVIAYLISEADEQKEVNVTQRKVAEEVEVSVTLVGKVFQRLVADGFLTKKERGTYQMAFDIKTPIDEGRTISFVIEHAGKNGINQEQYRLVLNQTK
jgi:DNA-binding transcriptional regulator YhcF (GntR family)